MLGGVPVGAVLGRSGAARRNRTGWPQACSRCIGRPCERELRHGDDRPADQAGRQRQVPRVPQGTLPNSLTSLALPHQIRSISKTRLLKWIGVLDADEARRAMENGILDHLGIEFDEEE